MRPRDGARHSIRERNGEETREGVNGHGSVGAHSRTRVAEGARYGEAGRNEALGAVRRTLIHDRANSLSKQLLISNFDEIILVATDVVATSSWLRMW